MLATYKIVARNCPDSQVGTAGEAFWKHYIGASQKRPGGQRIHPEFRTVRSGLSTAVPTRSPDLRLTVPGRSPKPGWWRSTCARAYAASGCSSWRVGASSTSSQSADANILLKVRPLVVAGESRHFFTSTQFDLDDERLAFGVGTLFMVGVRDSITALVLVPVAVGITGVPHHYARGDCGVHSARWVDLLCSAVVIFGLLGILCWRRSSRSRYINITGWLLLFKQGQRVVGGRQHDFHPRASCCRW